MNDIPASPQARQLLLRYLERMLVGPGLGIPDKDQGFEREIIEGRLSLAYMLGMLFPQNSEENDDLGGDEEQEVDDDTDDPLSMASALLPASMGLSFCLSDGAKVLLTVDAARYVKVENGNESSWRRVPLKLEKPELLTSGIGFSDRRIFDGLAALTVFPRKTENGWLTTVSVINTSSGLRSQYDKILFQVRISVELEEGRIIEYKTSNYIPPTEEEREIRILFGSQSAYAVGHGISADWKLDKTGHCVSVQTQALPRAHVWRPLFDRIERDTQTGTEVFSDPDIFKLSVLASEKTGDSQLIERLRRFVDFYSGWIESLERIPVDPALKEDAERIVGRCVESAGRMQSGIALLESSDIVRRSFRLANYSLLISMCHGRRLSGADRNDGLQGPFELGTAETSSIDYMSNTKAEWRPFQLAFLLQILPSLCDENHDDRDIVDVIWFATGGGKTEAYLLASAFELIHRRLKFGSRGGGTGVINRYTYRFLTSDQFQRTAGMICAMELLRRKLAKNGDNSLGDEEFSIGLFAGGDVSPNRFSQDETGAHQRRLSLEDSNQPRADNPFPIESCPSCGTLLVPNEAHRNADGSIDRAYYGFNSTSTSFNIFCPEESCSFHAGIPAYIVDEQLYDSPPSFLLGTIDKFAMVPWQERGGRLFGIGTAHEAPSLIIQDELHLISGPLGTLAGIFEAAFETLIQSKSGWAPKIVASTATIRNAELQCKRMYGRKGVVFPSPGLRAEDSFFARLDVGNFERSRLYVGLMGQGLRSTVAVAWTMAAVLQGVYEKGVSGEMTPAELDAYWTLIAYHNSKRELGRITSATRDEIPARLKVYARADDRERPSQFDVLELKAHSEVPIPLARQFLQRKHTNDQSGVDIVPCTNIISVGIDINRLGLMLVNGQPKLAAEYIQASSRVGRGGVPGLVISCYSPSKPRDRSHYESFRDFHERFYSFVEPTSVTPGSLPAIERALHSALITAVRHATGLRANPAAAQFRKDEPKIVTVLSTLERRLLAAYPDEDDRQIRQRISAALNTKCREWEDWATEYSNLQYRSASRQQHAVLMTPFGDPIYREVGWPSLQSMRHVDTELVLGW